MIYQALPLLFGISSSEFFVNRAYGEIGKKQQLMESVLLVAFLTLFLNSVYVDASKTALLYFMSGFLGVVFSRSVVTLFGFHSKKVLNAVAGNYDDTDYIIRLSRNLKKHGIEDEKISEILEKSGFKKEKIRKIMNS